MHCRSGCAVHTFMILRFRMPPCGLFSAPRGLLRDFLILLEMKFSLAERGFVYFAR